MLGQSTGCRPVERLARRAGYEIASAPHCKRGHWFAVDGRVIILVPTWLRGADYREGSISRQVELYRLAALGEAACVADLAALAATYAARQADASAAD